MYDNSDYSLAKCGMSVITSDRFLNRLPLPPFNQKYGN